MKKVKTDDVFDGILGSTAIRGETRTNIVLHSDGRDRFIAAEAREGRGMPSTLLSASVVCVEGAEVVRDYALGELLSDKEERCRVNTDRKRKETYTERVIAFLETQTGFSAPKTALIENVTGNSQQLLRAIEQLTAAGVIAVSGTKQSSTDPLTLHLDQGALKTHRFMSNHGGRDLNGALT